MQIIARKVLGFVSKSVHFVRLDGGRRVGGRGEGKNLFFIYKNICLYQKKIVPLRVFYKYAEILSNRISCSGGDCHLVWCV
jgi:hypothetical protein